MSRLLGSIATVGVTGAAMFMLLGQVRKPWGWPGRFVVWAMRLRHAGVTQWGLSRVEIGKAATILDVGCGSGAAIRALAAIAEHGRVFGVDYSRASVAAATTLNANLIAEGRVHIEHAAVSKLPFTDDMFDLVTAVETHYYWPDPTADLRELLRVLKPGGSLVLVAEQYRGERLSKVFSIPMKLVRATYYSVGETRDLLTTAGFTGVAIGVESMKGWISAVGRKPARAAA